MDFKYISDTHIHSDNSYDAQDPTIKLCEHAANIGLYSITITDHCNCNEYTHKNFRRAIRQAFFQTKKAQNVFKDTINVFTGIELGQPTHNESAAADALSLLDFDFVLAGIHKLKDSDNFSEIHYTNDNVNNIINKYFEDVIDLIEWGNFDSLAHITYPFQFIDKIPELKLDCNNLSKKINITLDRLSKKNKALEIDNYMLNEKKNNPLSSSHILYSFNKLGGKYITFGSNAHSCYDMGNGISKGLKDAFNAGFTHFSLFKNRAPHLLPIK